MGYNHRPRKEEQPFQVACESFAAHQHDEDTRQRQHHTDNQRKAYALAVGNPHPEGDKERYGGNNHRGQRTANELHSRRLAEVVDEWLAEGKQQKPFYVLLPYPLQSACKRQCRQHDERRYRQSDGNQHRDSHVLFRQEQLLGHYEADAPEDDRERYENICQQFGIHCAIA